MENTINSEFKDSLWKIALPSALQTLLFTSLSFVDSIMVGRLGQFEFNAVGMGAQLLFVASMINVGIVSATSIYMAQYYGAKDYTKYRSVIGVAIMSSGAFALAFSIMTTFFPRLLLSYTTTNEAILEHGVSYLRLAGLQLPFAAISLSLSVGFKTAKNAKIPLIVTGVGFFVNTILNYILIFGNFGAPEMRVKGAAIATIVARILNLVLYALMIYKTKNVIKDKISDMLAFSGKLFKKIFNTGWSVVVHECLWSIGLAMFGLLISRFSADSYSAYTISTMFMRFVFVFAFGINSAASVTIGAQLGRSDIDMAIVYEKKYTKTQIFVSVLSAALVIVLAHLLVGYFNVSDAIHESAIYMVYITCAVLPFKLYTGMHTAGILRAGGDTIVPVLYELASLYIFKIPILYFLAKYTDTSFEMILIYTSISDLLLTVLIYGRVKTKKWAKNLITEEQNA